MGKFSAWVIIMDIIAKLENLTNFQLFESIKKYPLLRGIIESITRINKVKLAIIFGSYAKGKATKESDIDLYVETKDIKLKEEIAKINSKLNVKIGLYDRQSLLIKEIERNHLVIKGIEKYYEKTKFFE